MAGTMIGGSFAPPLTDEKLAEYELLAKDCPDRRAAGYMADLCKMMRVFRETPESKAKPRKHPVAGLMVPLEEAEVQRIWDFVPWAEECDLMGATFDKLQKGECAENATRMAVWQLKGSTASAPPELLDTRLRDAAFHLLWFARELEKDREPCTRDKL
jgi:hypothetical protein